MEKGGYIAVFILVLIIVVLALTNPSFIQRMTGYATEDTIDINISVSGNKAPNVTIIRNDTMTDVSGGPTEATSSTTIQINFTAYDADGFGNINDSSAAINFSKSGETSRINSSCVNLGDYGLYYTNYTCIVTMWWWDGAGIWNINASIADNDGNSNSNASETLYLGTTDGVAMSPTTLTWTSLTAGATNQNANENITLNNTGNVDKWVEVNATNLRGETDPTLAIWAGNFSIKNISGCEGTSMVNDVFTNVTSATLLAGNISLNFANLTSGQEEIAVCIEEAGSELIAQAYSTANTTENSWTIKITTQT